MLIRDQEYMPAFIDVIITPVAAGLRVKSQREERQLLVSTPDSLRMYVPLSLTATLQK